MGLVRLRSDSRSGFECEPRVLRTWAERLRGLLGTDSRARPVLIARCGSIHTVGMSYAIDVAFVGDGGEVLRSERALPAGRVRSCPGARCVLERPAREGPWPERGERLWAVSASADSVGL